VLFLARKRMSSDVLKYESTEQLLSESLEILQKLLKKYGIAPGNLKNATVRKLKVKKLWAKIEEIRASQDQPYGSVVTASEPINLDISSLNLGGQSNGLKTESVERVSEKKNEDARDSSVESGSVEKDMNLESLMAMDKVEFIKILDQFGIVPKGNIMQKFIKKKFARQVLEKFSGNNSTNCPVPSGTIATQSALEPLEVEPTDPNITELPTSPVESPRPETTLLNKSLNQFYAVRPSTPLRPSTPQIETYVFNQISHALTKFKSLKDRQATLSGRKTKYEDAIDFLTQDDAKMRNPGAGPKLGQEPLLNDSPKVGEKDFLVVKLLIERRGKMASIPKEEVIQKLEDYLRENPNRIMTKQSYHPVILAPNFRWNAIHIAATKDFPEVLTLYHKLLTEEDGFLKELFKYQSEEKRRLDSQQLYHAYFNSPDKVALDSPLNLAAKYAFPDVLEILLRVAMVDVDKMDKFGNLPARMVGSRVRGELTPEQEQNIARSNELFQNMFIMELDTDEGAIIRYCKNCEPKNFVGPAVKADLFNLQVQLRRKWTRVDSGRLSGGPLTPLPAHLGVHERTKYTLSDFEKGRSAYVRLLCRRLDLIYHEFWPFLGKTVTWGDNILEALEWVEGTLEDKRDCNVQVNGMDALLDDTMDELCFQFDNFHFHDDPVDTVTSKSSGISVTTLSPVEPLYLESADSATKADTQFFDAINQYYSNDVDDVRTAINADFPETLAWYENIAQNYSQKNQRSCLKTPIRSKTRKHSGTPSTN